MSSDRRFGPASVRVERDGVTESVHICHVAVCDVGGRVLMSLGDAAAIIYPRSSLKPFQAAAVLDLLGACPVPALDERAVAIIAASHEGDTDQQIEAARVLALADLDESALRCPASLPMHLETLLEQRVAEPLAHNCSGKHAGMLAATVAVGADPSAYLDVAAPVQRRIRDRITASAGTSPPGAGIDGCGAPAWRLPLQGLATAFARMAHDETLVRVGDAMRRHPGLVGGSRAVDTVLMRAEPALVAKRGAEGVLGLWYGPRGRAPVGIAVKAADGAMRAAATVAVAVVRGMGGAVPASVPEGGEPSAAVPDGGLHAVLPEEAILRLRDCLQ